jgi:hypothetical protein
MQYTGAGVCITTGRLPVVGAVAVVPDTPSVLIGVALKEMAPYGSVSERGMDAAHVVWSWTVHIWAWLCWPAPPEMQVQVPDEPEEEPPGDPPPPPEKGPVF